MSEVGTAPRSPQRILAPCVLATISAAAPPFLVGILSVQMRHDFRFDTVRVGVCVAAYYVVSAAGSVPCGRLVARYGVRTSLRFVAMANALAMAAVAPVSDWRFVFGALAVAGAGNSMAQPAVSAALTAGVSSANRGFAFGANQASVPLAALVSAALVPTVSLTVGWRWCLVVFAAAAFAVALTVPPMPSGRRADGGNDTLGRTMSRTLVKLAVAAVFASMVGTSLATFLAISAAAVGMSASAAAGVQIAASTLCIGVRLLSGWFGRRHRADYLPHVCVLLLGGAVGCALIATGTAGLFTAGALIAFALGWGWNGLFNLSISNRYGNVVARATGVTQAGVYAGGVLGPVLFGLLQQHAGQAAAWQTTAGAGVVGVALVLTARRSLAASHTSVPTVQQATDRGRCISADQSGAEGEVSTAM